MTNAPMDRSRFLDWFDLNRERTGTIFDLLESNAYYTQPIALRHPIVFYEGHLPAFNVNTFIKRGLGQRGVDERLERLFARGIDPDDEQVNGQAALLWPTRGEVEKYADAADRLVRGALETQPLALPGHPVLDRAEGIFTFLEHEALHQETLLYMWHRLPLDMKRRPGSLPAADVDARPPSPRVVRVPAGRATLGAERGDIAFGWDNEFPSLQVDVPAFEIDVFNVTNADYLKFIDAGGYDRPDWWTPEGWRWRTEQQVTHPLFWERDPSANGRGPWLWRGQFDLLPLPLAWPVYVSHAEASAYACWRGARLPTEAEYHRAAFGTPSGVERSYPWGEDAPTAAHGNFDFERWDPVPVGSRPAGASAWGVEDLLGNGWEWTSTPFAGFPGFQAMPSYPEYSADFFDNQHFVMKGASPVTAKPLLRRSLRNWFRPNYPYVYAAFRCVTPVK